MKRWLWIGPCAGAMNLVACGALVGLGDTPGGRGDAGLEAGAFVDASETRDSSEPTDADNAGDVAEAGDVRDAGDAGDVRDAGDAGDVRDAGDASVLTPSSCLQIKTVTPSAPSGVYTLTDDGKTFQTYCDMDTGGGGWTAFFVDMIGSSHAIGHFDFLTADVCPFPAAQCLRRIPADLAPSTRFAARCGNDAVAFDGSDELSSYLEGNGQGGWIALSNVVALAGSPNPAYATHFFAGFGSTGSGYLGNTGWILSSDDVDPQESTHTFASSYNFEPGTWDYCNGVDYNGAVGDTPVVMLLYR